MKCVPTKEAMPDWEVNSSFPGMDGLLEEDVRGWGPQASFRERPAPVGG